MSTSESRAIVREQTRALLETRERETTALEISSRYPERYERGNLHRDHG